MKKLPKKPSELIRLSLADLEKIEKNKKYVVEMFDWHVPNEDNKCEVCLAGSVMACTLKIKPDQDLCPEDTEYSNELLAINEFRIGEIYEALELLDID